MPNWIKPFHDPPSEEYHYFSVEKITENVRISQLIYDKALALVNSRQAELKRIVFSYDEYQNSEVTAYFTVKIKSFQNVRVTISKDSLVQCQCTDSSCVFSHSRSKYGICEHEAAALILTERYLAEHRPGDSTDSNAFTFLEQFRSSHRTGSEKLKNTVQLLPRIVYDKKTLFLRLLITTAEIQKYYIVRNISDLLSDIDAGNSYALGKNYQIDFSQEGFAEESCDFLKLIRGWKDDKEEETPVRYYYYNDDDMKSSIRLYGNRLDRFFDLFYEKELEFNSPRDKKIKLKTCNPQIQLHIRKLTDSSGIFQGITVSGKLFSLLHGNQYDYCISDDCICRLEESYAGELRPLMMLTKDSSGSVYFQIGRKNLAEFYYTVLPELKKIAVIQEEDSEEIEKFLPPEVAFKFYLDIDNGRPECRVGTWYGDTGVAIFDLLSSPVLKEDFRDAQRERYVLDTVQHYFPEFRGYEERFLAPGNEESIYAILQHAVPEFITLGDVICTERFQKLRTRKTLKISVGVSVENDLLNLEIMTEDLSPKELLEILKSYRQNKKYHRLKTGEFVDLDDSIAELSAMLETMHISPKEFVRGKMQLPAYRAFYLDKMLEQSSEIYARRDTHYKQLIRNMKTITESDYEIPDSLQHTMRGYQRFGYKWLRTLADCGFGGILADDMGLGKTLQMISVLLAEKREKQAGTSLVICPASLVFNWAAEFEKFAPELRFCTIAGTQKERTARISQYQDYDVLISSYDLIKRDIDHYEACEFNYQILDEAQYIKNHTTAAAKSVKLIHAKHKFALTGTPIENRLSELWSIFDYLMPGFLYHYEEFKRDFETPIVRRSDETMTKRLRRMTSVFILRRLKKDVLRDLPDKLEENYIVCLNEEQRHIYDAKVLELKQLLENAGTEGFQTIKLQIFAFLTQIRQICCDPSLLFSDYQSESAKRTACMELVQRAIEGEHRILIFSQFVTMLEKLEQDLKEQGISCYKITGETSKKKRLELVESFNSGSTPVFLISLKAGGTGLNLTGADVVIHYDPWWNVAAQNQATDRAHRIGQTRAVTVYKLIAKDTIEEKIQKMQEKKQNLADSVLSGEFVSLSSLSKEDLLEILG